MSNPRHQHFIPKSYLKNFSQTIDGKHFVEAKLSSEPQPKQNLISIRDICVDKNIYTLPYKDGEDKYALERYYAEKIDEVYPEAYQWLVNPHVIKITAEQRLKIIMTTMSLFFRTPKFLNNNERTIDRMLDYASRNLKDKFDKVSLKFKDYDLNFHIDEIESVRAKLIVQNKVDFLQNHLKDWHQFVNFKMKSAIMVIKIVDDFNLITSDNPVVMHSSRNNPFELFDPTNIIHLPLDSKHYLTLMPNTEEAELNTIYRCERDKWFVLTTNLQVEQSCEDWILGKPNTVSNHLSDQKKYNEHNIENLSEVEDMRRRGVDGLELAKLMEQFGAIHEKVANKLNELMKDKIHKNDVEMQKIKKMLERFGHKFDD